jgi:hypothetical protein
MDKNKGNQRKPSGPQNKPNQGKQSSLRNKLFANMDKPSSKQFETLHKLIIMRLGEEQSKNEQLINWLLDKGQLTKEQLAFFLISQMLYIKKRLDAKQLTKERLKTEQFIENALNDEQLIEKVLNDEQLIMTLLNDEQLIEKVLNDEQLIKMVFERTFTYIRFNPNLIHPGSLPLSSP